MSWSYKDKLKREIDSCRYWLELPVEHTCRAEYPIGSCKACDFEDLESTLKEALAREELVQELIRVWGAYTDEQSDGFGGHCRCTSAPERAQINALVSKLKEANGE